MGFVQNWIDRKRRRELEQINREIEELKRNAGKQFDPEIVEAFLQTNLSEREKNGVTLHG